ncbi:diguanylate cyclase [Parahaliea sp. F7430]|uniref:Diguanylate cyclase n=1 Tax=Sediminihaliea albiluteola TaxID=2758564 RepID=A0A7W2TTT6_9GAMM|nr:diguanylate cyclase [Sediminihaliea albiluteola]MBA6411825.1 diguanylate cyclase [Sediminihaliea albiluteola]
MSDLKAAEQAKAKLSAALLEQSLKYTANDLLAISKLPAVKRFNRDRSELGKDWLEQVFRAQLEQKTVYQQLRFLDSEGVEMSRVERRSKQVLATPEQDLQAKGDRYYFRDTRTLDEDDVYISPLDLNVENTVVELPYKPMIRFGVRVVDKTGQHEGVLVLNMKGQYLLDAFRASMTNKYPAFLLNAQGHVLAGPNKSDEWSFMFDLPAAFKRDYPEAFEQVLAEDNGTFESAQGLFAYETVEPLKKFSQSSSEHHYRWKAVSFVPREQLPAAILFNHPGVIAFYIVGLLMWLTAAFYFQYSLHKRRELKLINERQSKRFWRISSVLGDGLIVMDKEGKVTYINPEAERILGWDFDEIVSKQGHHVFHVHDGDESSCSILNVMETQELYRSKDEVFRRKNDATIPVILNAAPLTSDTGDEGVVVSFQDFSETKSYQEKIQSLAYEDSLTGLPNRRVLQDRLQLAIALSARHARSVGLMFLDLDHFKEVNDTYGHDAGDILLKEIAVRLQNCVRETDSVVRIGGDEFVILLPDVSSADNAVTVANKIIQSVGEPISLPDGEARVGVSIGIALARGTGASSESLMQRADDAMYEAKRRGKNQFYISE